MRHRVESLIVPLVLVVMLGSCCGPCVLVDAGYGDWVRNGTVAVVLTFTGVATGGAWLARRDAHRKRFVLCLYCGYDLRSSGGRCPECGTSRGSGRPPDGGVA